MQFMSESQSCSRPFRNRERQVHLHSPLYRQRAFLPRPLNSLQTHHRCPTPSSGHPLLAERLAQSRDTMLGQAVGSHIGRSRARVNKDKTIINCTTYGILLHYARMDPMFMNYSVIILDEVHEDSPELYFLFSIVRKALKVNRELKVILMSAMVDSDKISGFFEKCDVIEVSGRSHPIEEFYEGSLSTDEMTYTSLAIEKALELHTTTPMDDNPDILVFLPLSKPIEDCAALFSERARQKIGDAARNIFAFGLHSGVPDEDKRFILKRGRIEEWGEIQRRAAAAEEGDSDVEGGVKDVFGDKGIWAGEGNSLNDTLSRIINDVSNPTRKPRDVISTIDLVDEDERHSE
ncbi:hypothetical protein BC829DRAFT_182854 [Chytridium lagenaria]|nr:hypothetical protein BC829DRAFT_182854 [Chytridium lagenaria]